MDRGFLATLVISLVNWLRRRQTKKEKRLQESLRQTEYWVGRLEKIIDIWKNDVSSVNFVLLPTDNEPQLTRSERQAEHMRDLMLARDHANFQLPVVRPFIPATLPLVVNMRVLNRAKLELIMFWLSEGLSKSEMARRLHVSRSTVGRYIKLVQRLSSQQPIA